MLVEPLAILGAASILLDPRIDGRGSFLKMFSAETWSEAGLSHETREVYYSTSHSSVLRGMHFQLPPHDHTKVVHCQSGRALDVVLDLRRSSPSYGLAVGRLLDAETPSAIFVPQGCAHGFLSLSENTTLLYLVSTVYHPESDSGIRWDSFGFDWPIESPLLSERDQRFSRFESWDTPF